MKKAYSLAEVLLTLMIIGVIASLTLPGLQQNAKQQELAVSCKKAFSTLSNALALAEQANGPIRKWGLTDNTSYEDFEEYILPYLNASKVCNDSSGCFGEGTYSQYDKSAYASISEKGYGTPGVAVSLADGTSISYDMQSGQNTGSATEIFGVKTTAPVVVFAVDVNGPKPPNMLGGDTYFFVATREGLKPAGADKSVSDIDCGKGKAGTECAAMVINYGDLNYDKHKESAKNSGNDNEGGNGGEATGGSKQPSDKRKGS